MRIPYDTLRDTLATLLTSLGFPADDAAECARVFADASRDGVASHGLDRVPRFVGMVRDGVVDPAARPVTLATHGALERWDGRRGAGPLNAGRAMDRAIALARAHGVGCVALGNTNHWMRGGTYGWQAADAGVVGLCWTNTLPNMPPWGSAVPRLGNNPLVVAVPRADGHVVLDMAMSQFSYGALASHRRRGEPLPVPGGFDEAGALTTDPAGIERSGRVLPIGYWKGSGLSLVLDLVAALLAGGRATHEIPTDPARESGLSQLFLAIDPALGDGPGSTIVDAVVDDLHHATGARYPGERALRTREVSLRDGVAVDDEVWTLVRSWVEKGSIS
ncbi:Malate/L-lactate dehydrogenase [Gemmatirosa kalamazoonensis]|uniref:Malate/L-lactate dehydrogenase n=1 Tax=Gemmatirosa kalamazoonensis TaxID=861299 RepID=W0RD63_9BACT|nr:3-dehydro-L-gulonate 2-dehydrogenase [Gemmatirosa kalamazoonensis]AHG88250.1 Malate/L-lactate dehydrogenase [Gemmatirosa kalamazoonensis]